MMSPHSASRRARKELTPSQPSDARQPGETCIPGLLLFSFPVILHTHTQPAWPSPSREGDCLLVVAWLCFMMLIFKPEWEQRQRTASCVTRSCLLCLSLACDSGSSALVLVVSASDLRGPAERAGVRSWSHRGRGLLTLLAAAFSGT